MQRDRLAAFCMSGQGRQGRPSHPGGSSRTCSTDLRHALEIPCGQLGSETLAGVVPTDGGGEDLPFIGERVVDLVDVQDRIPVARTERAAELVRLADLEEGGGDLEAGPQRVLSEGDHIALAQQVSALDPPVALTVNRLVGDQLQLDVTTVGTDGCEDRALGEDHHQIFSFL